MLNKLFETYEWFILAENKNWLDYIYINLYNIIYQII